LTFELRKFITSATETAKIKTLKLTTVEATPQHSNNKNKKRNKKNNDKKTTTKQQK